MAFGNEDAIDKRNRTRIHDLESALNSAIVALEKSTSLTQREKAEAIRVGRIVLSGDAFNSNAQLPSGAYC